MIETTEKLEKARQQMIEITEKLEKTREEEIARTKIKVEEMSVQEISSTKI